MASITSAAAALLDAHPDGLPVHQLVRALKRSGWSRASRAVVENALASDGRFERHTILGRALWRLRAEPAVPVPPRPAIVDPADPLRGLSLRDWQVAAFAAWAAAGCRGVVEAVTGTGKTRLALAAVRACLARGGRVLVVVPTLDLQRQWVGQVRAHVHGARIGLLGGGRADDVDGHDVVVATAQSAAAVPITPPHGAVGLLVADEAHRYGAPTWGAALHPAFPMRLALTATYERTDDGLVEVLGPYFGGVVYRYSFAQAAGDGVIAPFDVVFAGVDLTEQERGAYDAADARVREHRRTLVDLGLPRAPLDLIAAAARISGAADGRPDAHDHPEVSAARAFLSALRERRAVAAAATAKLTAVSALGPGLAASGTRGLVFTETVEQARQAARILTGAGVAAEEIHGDLPERRRRIRMAQFRNGALQVVAAPRVLDEGVDVPEAALAVVLAAFRTRRQMIQRLGRVLRRRPDGSAARLIVVYARGTREDPARGAQEDFLSEVTGVARSITTVDAAGLGRVTAQAEPSPSAAAT